MSDLELAEIRDDIKATKGKLASAEDAGDKELIVAYSNTLTEQQKTLNILLAGAGDLIL
jgi:heterodisulfide reductase subunit A-like polyferredoxin